MAYVSSVPLTSIMTVVYAFMKNAPCYGYISQPVGDIIGIHIKRPRRSEYLLASSCAVPSTTVQDKNKLRQV
ncbi:hypothetical protein T03_12037 [Trichinella britovi]|uniref:Uncharacterized protein n=1 Tax=Trichinella britovi TaxID=45882 RepID=A0A0V1C758_TRIBR|nr:hypothetical protein T03_12037 [Trichinella britovi]